MYGPKAHGARWTHPRTKKGFRENLHNMSTPSDVHRKYNDRGWTLFESTLIDAKGAGEIGQRWAMLFEFCSNVLEHKLKILVERVRDEIDSFEAQSGYLHRAVPRRSSTIALFLRLENGIQ